MKLPPVEALRSIIVRLPNALGDTVMATSVLRRLAAVVPPAALCIAGGKVALDVLSGNPWAASTLELDRKGRHRGLRGLFRLAGEIRTGGHDLAVILPNSFGTALAFALAGVPHRLGYFKEGRRWLLTAGRARRRDAAGRFEPVYTGQYFQELLDVLPSLPPVPLKPVLHLDPGGEAEAAAWIASAGLQAGEPLLIVVPGAAFGPSKIWVPERYAEVADALARRYRARVLVSSGPGEEQIAGAVKAAMQVSPLPDARLSLRGLKGVFQRATFVVTNDTGPRHLAVAFDVPNVCIMGPNDPRYTHLDDEAGEVVRAGVDCQPCQLKVCPLAEKICMTRLSVAQVLEACERHWPGASGAGAKAAASAL